MQCKAVFITGAKQGILSPVFGGVEVALHAEVLPSEAAGCGALLHKEGTFFTMGLNIDLVKYVSSILKLWEKKDLSLLTCRLTLLLKPVPNTDQFPCQNSPAKQFISNSLTHLRKQLEFSKCPFAF